MITFKVDDMSCGHCVSSITKAIHTTDPTARVSIDLARHRVDIDAAQLNPAGLSAAISEAGYTPVLVEASAPPVAKPAARSGCCCR